jgi:hypothetical protein
LVPGHSGQGCIGYRDRGQNSLIWATIATNAPDVIAVQIGGSVWRAFASRW